MRKYIILLFISVFNYSFAQNILTTSGGDSNGVLWNIGQIITETVFDDNATVFQGLITSEEQVNVSVESSNQDIISIEVYPNPAKDRLFVESSDGTGFTWRLVDMIGRNVKSGITSSGKDEINLSEYSAGQYILVLKSEKNIQSVIIQKN